ncbi:MAG: cytochrome c1 [Xanthomonadales bacterium]|nr:cytochrome c1 [Xanthomonadales bacterium]
MMSSIKIKIKSKIVFAAVLLLLSVSVLAAGGGKFKQVNINVHDKSALQRGAVLFVNNCLSCHSAAYMRYNRLGEDLGLSEDQVRETFLPANAKIGDTMTVSMTADEATAWFGNKAPDLSVVGRSKGANWLNAYLTSFYQDENGEWNNTVFPDLVMPHVFWEQQGVQKAIFKDEEDAHGYTHKVFSHFETVSEGSQSAEEYQSTIHDLVTYLIYMGEPARIQRESMGIWVLLFLAMFTLVAYMLKVEYWKDIH